jgi:hypothetical protein
MKRQTFARHRRSIMLLLMAALVLVQVLGVMHAVLHEHSRFRPATAASTAIVDPADSDSWVKTLFAEHDSQADCDHYDHMTHADQAWFDVPSFGHASTQEISLAFHSGWHLAQQAAGFLARGPPSQV